MAHASILNDVIGPIMRGPSSSHTAGAYRIAQLACNLAGERPAAIRCTFDPSGSYAPTYLALGVDMAFAAGCPGWEMTDARYKQSMQAAVDAHLPISFDIEPLTWADHPNAIRIAISLPSGAPCEIWAKSTGGGIVEIYRVNNREVSIDGRSWSVLMLVDSEDSSTAQKAVEGLLNQNIRWHEDGQSGDVLLQADAAQPISHELADRIAAVDGVKWVRFARPVLFTQPGEALFLDAADMIQIATDENTTLGNIAGRYESVLLDQPEEVVKEELITRYRVMRQAVEDGQDESQVDLSYCSPSAGRILDAEKRGTLPLGGMLTRAAARAMACMHVCNSKGVVCAAPTGGAAGVLAGTLVTLEIDQGVAEDVIARALLAAGAVGLIVAERATFAAETAGCQVEIGVAGAMAAAAVVEVAGGTARQACDAAAICLQNTMGSVCDPVGGGCEIPCHTRNAVAAANAFTCADLVMGGYGNPISLDETIDASYAVGRALPRELRCTALGGLAITPSAKRLVAQDESGAECCRRNQTGK